MFVVVDSRSAEKALQPINEAIVRAAISITLNVPVGDKLVDETLADMQLTDCKFGDGKGRVFLHLYSAEEARQAFGRRARRANVRTLRAGGLPISIGYVPPNIPTVSDVRALSEVPA